MTDVPNADPITFEEIQALAERAQRTGQIALQGVLYAVAASLAQGNVASMFLALRPFVEVSRLMAIRELAEARAGWTEAPNAKHL